MICATNTYRNQLNYGTWDIVVHFQPDKLTYFLTHRDTRIGLEPKHKPDRTFRKLQLTVDGLCKLWCDLLEIDCAAIEHSTQKMNYPNHYNDFK